MLVLALLLALYSLGAVERVYTYRTVLGSGLHHGMVADLVGAGSVTRMPIAGSRLVAESSCSCLNFTIIELGGKKREYVCTDRVDVEVTPSAALILEVPRGCKVNMTLTVRVLEHPHAWAALVSLVLATAGTVMVFYSLVCRVILP